MKAEGARNQKLVVVTPVSQLTRAQNLTEEFLLSRRPRRTGAKAKLALLRHARDTGCLTRTASRKTSRTPGGTTVTLVLGMMALGLREGKEAAQGHTQSASEKSQTGLQAE